MRAQPLFQLSPTLVWVLGVVLGLWVGFGRFLFDKDGPFTVVYVLLVTVPVITLHLFIARNLRRVRAAGHVQRRATVYSLLTAWLCLAVLGLLLPDRPVASLETIATGATEPWLSIAIGIANPIGIIGISLTVAGLLLSRTDVQGLRPSEDELLDAAGI